MPDRDAGHDEQCTVARELIAQVESGAVQGDEELRHARSRIDGHLGQCQSCLAWRQQSCDLVAAASLLPQFDVPEALTQRIFASIDFEERKRTSTASNLSVMLLIAVAFAILFFFDSFDNVEGLLSWCLGLASLAVLRFLVVDSTSGNAVVSR